MRDINALTEQMGAGDSDDDLNDPYEQPSVCDYCERPECGGNCADFRELDVALRATDAAFRATMEAGR
jgi:hypothetical protein